MYKSLLVASLFFCLGPTGCTLDVTRQDPCTVNTPNTCTTNNGQYTQGYNQPINTINTQPFSSTAEMLYIVDGDTVQVQTNNRIVVVHLEGVANHAINEDIIRDWAFYNQYVEVEVRQQLSVDEWVAYIHSQSGGSSLNSILVGR